MTPMSPLSDMEDLNDIKKDDFIGVETNIRFEENEKKRPVE